MSADDSPAYQRRTLGRRLRALRTAACLNSDQACERLELSGTTLNRIERGTTGVGIHTVKSMLDLYGVGADEWEPILETVREANRKGWWTEFGLTNSSYTALETAASGIWAFCFGYLHGLLQTEDYMEAVFRSSLVPRTQKQFLDQIAVRKVRQERLLALEDPLELVVVIDESSLRRPVGGRVVMRTQLVHLLHMAELATVTLHALPTETGAHVGAYGSFSVLGFPDSQAPDMGYYDHVNGPTFVNRVADVQRCKLKLEHLRSLALSPADSTALIRRILDDL